MKIREDFVTNSSSSSYIICFARIADEEKANEIIKNYEKYIQVIDNDRLNFIQGRRGEIGADWCGATVDVSKMNEKYPNSKFIIIEDENDAYEDWETGEIDYDDTFDCDVAISQIKESNGFDEIQKRYGEGRNG